MAKVPEGYHSVTLYLIVEGAADLLEFTKQAFGAEERMRMDASDGSVAHAEVEIGDSVVMVGGASERWPASPGTIHLYVDDCEATYAKALEAGATSEQEPEDQFYGDQMAGVRDAFGNMWWIAARVEDVAPDELEKRAAEWAAGQER